MNPFSLATRDGHFAIIESLKQYQYSPVIDLKAYDNGLPLTGHLFVFLDNHSYFTSSVLSQVESHFQWLLNEGSPFDFEVPPSDFNRSLSDLQRFSHQSSFYQEKNSNRLHSSLLSLLFYQRKGSLVWDKFPPERLKELSTQYPLLHLAVHLGLESCVSQLLQAGADPNQPHPGALFPLLYCKNKSIFIELIRAGAKINTPLNRALETPSLPESTTVFQELTKSLSDPEFLNMLTRTSLAESQHQNTQNIQFQQGKIVKLSLDASAQQSLFHSFVTALKEGDKNKMKVLKKTLGKHFWGMKTNNGTPLLSWAIQFKSPSLAKETFYTNAVDINEFNHVGKNPFLMLLTQSIMKGERFRNNERIEWFNDMLKQVRWDHLDSKTGCGYFEACWRLSPDHSNFKCQSPDRNQFWNPLLTHILSDGFQWLKQYPNAVKDPQTSCIKDSRYNPPSPLHFLLTSSLIQTEASYGSFENFFNESILKKTNQAPQYQHGCCFLYIFDQMIESKKISSQELRDLFVHIFSKNPNSDHFFERFNKIHINQSSWNIKVIQPRFEALFQRLFSQVEHDLDMDWKSFIPNPYFFDHSPSSQSSLQNRLLSDLVQIQSSQAPVVAKPKRL